LSRLRLRHLLAAAVGLAACAGGSAGERWRAPDGSSATLSASSDCHVQASRLAAARYPDQIERTSPSGATYRQSNPERFPAEIRFYEACMGTKGYAR